MIETENENCGKSIEGFREAYRAGVQLGRSEIEISVLDSLGELNNLYCNLAIKSLFNKTNGALIDHKGKVLQKRT